MNFLIYLGIGLAVAIISDVIVYRISGDLDEFITIVTNAWLVVYWPIYVIIMSITIPLYFVVTRVCDHYDREYCRKKGIPYE